MGTTNNYYLLFFFCQKQNKKEYATYIYIYINLCTQKILTLFLFSCYNINRIIFVIFAAFLQNYGYGPKIGRKLDKYSLNFLYTFLLDGM